MQSLLLMMSGLTLLTCGAVLLDCALSRMARQARVSPLLSGTTLTACAAIMPTLTTSVTAGFQGHSDFAAGVIFGAFIGNLLGALGLFAVISPVRVVYRMVRGNVPFMIFVAGLVWLFASNSRITPLENTALLVLAPVYIAFILYYAHKIRAGDNEFSPLPPLHKKALSIPVAGGCLAGCAVFLYLGTRLLLTGVIGAAQRTGLSELTLGLTAAGAGLSLPVLVASLRACLRGERTLIAGNMVSGNVLLLLCALPLAGFGASGTLFINSALCDLELPAVFVIAVICLPVFVTRAVVSRVEGACFLFCYALYILLTGLRAFNGPLYPLLTDMVFYALLPGIGFFVILALWFAYYEVEILAADLTEDMTDLALTTLKNTRKIVVTVVGITLILVGIAMMVLPGPATIVIPLGLAVLSTEFLWAKRLLNYVRKEIEHAAAKIVGTKENE